MPIKSPRFKTSTDVGAPPSDEQDASPSAPEVAAEALPEKPVAAVPVGPPRKIYPIVKYGDAILEKNTAAVTKFDAELAELGIHVHLCGVTP